MEEKVNTLIRVCDEDTFDYVSQFGNNDRNRIVYDINDLIKIQTENESKVYDNINFKKLLLDIPNIKEKTFHVLYGNSSNEYDGKKTETYISTLILMGNLIKKGRNEFFVNTEKIGRQDIFLNQFMKLRYWK
jgi:hypothetical protein